MRRKINVRSFEMENTILRYDQEKLILVCISRIISNKKLWVKKIQNFTDITDVIEDNNRYYVVCESGDINGQFLALQKENGITKWFIPGKSFLYVIYKRYLYLIFSDEKSQYYLLKAHTSNGKSAWYYPVDRDLKEYAFKNNRIELLYSSGKTELLSIRTGKLQV